MAFKKQWNFGDMKRVPFYRLNNKTIALSVSVLQRLYAIASAKLAAFLEPFQCPLMAGSRLSITQIDHSSVGTTFRFSDRRDCAHCRLLESGLIKPVEVGTRKKCSNPRLRFESSESRFSVHLHTWSHHHYP